MARSGRILIHLADVMFLGAAATLAFWVSGAFGLWPDPVLRLKDAIADAFVQAFPASRLGLDHFALVDYAQLVSLGLDIALGVSLAAALACAAATIARARQIGRYAPRGV